MTNEMKRLLDVIYLRRIISPEDYRYVIGEMSEAEWIETPESKDYKAMKEGTRSEKSVG